MVTVSVKLTPDMAAKVAAESCAKRISKSDIIRDSLHSRYAKNKSKKLRPSIYELTKHLAGSLKSALSDLSTNKKYMEGFGES